MNDSAGRAGPDPRLVAFLLSQVGGLAALRFTERVAALGLTPAHTGLLRTVAAEPGLSQHAVSTRLGLLPSRLVSLVDDLERDGLVERRRNPHDRRHHALHLTPSGQRRLAEVAVLALEHADDMLAPLAERERVTLGRLLEKLATHHGLQPGVHPGYRSLGRDQASARGATSRPRAG